MIAEQRGLAYTHETAIAALTLFTPLMYLFDAVTFLFSRSYFH
jgi:hypothetical protein